ncbi:MAG: GFA family protein, partial [Pelagibacteraceae bacterium]
MTVKETHIGGCACGENRYETSGNPERARVCHCRYCQLRSGSPFGVGAWFKDENIKHLSKNYNQYKFTTESGNNFETNFCKKCGTTVYWTISAPALKGLTAIAAATFDPPSFWF